MHKGALDGRAVAELCRKQGIKHATFYNWRSKYGGLDGVAPVTPEQAVG